LFYLPFSKNVARGLSAFLSDLLPSSLDSPDSLPLLNDLCQLVSILLRRPMQGSNTTVDIAFNFMRNVFRQFGKTLAMGFDHRSDQYAASNGIEVDRLLRNLILNVVETVQESLGPVWAKPSEQDNGQVAFESKPMPTQKVTLKSSEWLGGMLDVLTQGLVFCPKFLIHLPTPGSGLRDTNTSDDVLLRRAVDAAAASLEDYSDVDGLRSAILFLKTLVRKSAVLYICVLVTYSAANWNLTWLLCFRTYRYSFIPWTLWDNRILSSGSLEYVPELFMYWCLVRVESIAVPFWERFPNCCFCSYKVRPRCMMLTLNRTFPRHCIRTINLRWVTVLERPRISFY
jgi:hypothetical protein